MAVEPKIGECSIFNPNLIGFVETSSCWSVQIFSASPWPPSVGKPRITPLFLSRLRKRTRFHRSTSVGTNDSGILRQDYRIICEDYGIIQGLPIGSPAGQCIKRKGSKRA